jgi:glycosyltransferase involved in cell wall biosynthesis
VWNRLPLHKRIALHSADRIWTISDYTAVRLVTEQSVDRDKIDVIPVPLDPDFAVVSARQAVARLSTRSRLLSISRLNGADAGKGIDCVISALPDIRSRVPDVTYVVIGDGDDRQRLELLTVSHGVSDIVSFVGHVPDPELHAYLRACFQTG